MKKTVLIFALCAMLCLNACVSRTPMPTDAEHTVSQKSAETSESERSKPETSEAEASELETSEAEFFETETSETEFSEAETSETEFSETETSETEFSETETSETEFSVFPGNDIADMLKPVESVPMLKVSDINLNIPAVFKITRPDDKITTTYSQYFIAGTSDPKKPVYFGNKEIERIGTKGTFGVLVDLKLGDNKFTFSQGEKTQTVTITRKTYVPADAVPISDIRQSSMIPAVFSGVNAGETLDVGCIAPSGANVTASFGGQTVKLSQVAQTAKAGIPAFFKGKITVGSDYSPNVTKDSGKVVYAMSYDGKSKKYESTGSVYVAGEGARAAVEIKSYMGFVYPDTNDLSVFREKLKKGAADYIKSQDNTYVELESGGFVNKEQVSIIEGNFSVQNKLSKVKLSTSSKGETYTFSGTNVPTYLTRLSNGKFSFTLFNTTDSPSVSMSSSKLFSGVEVVTGNNYVTYTFTQSNSSMLWGYDVSYDKNNTVLSFNYKPTLRSGSKPFEGITIVLDPGHGGTDPGALGVAASTGPTENDVNLAHAVAARDLLQSMGAKVILTRPTDIYYSLDDRLASSEKLKADIFISIHHNSIGENSDANNIKGVEVYYHTGLSKKLAQSLMTSVTGLGRSSRFVSQSYYRVTLSSYAPAVLIELGFMSNPLEYERAATPSQIDKVAKAIADGIAATLS